MEYTMPTCPKCRKQNPDDAAFCGFCGSQIVPKGPAAQPARTVFGYTADPKLAAQQKAAPPAPPAPQAAAPVADTVPVQRAGGAEVLIGGRYLLGAQTRRLAAGEVFLAKDGKQELEVELLLVDNAVFPSPLDMERARRELRQLQKVDCTAIVKVVDHGKAEDGRLFIAMERFAGQCLDELVGRGTLDLATTQQVIKGVGNGLAEAQKMGVIHRDIAPHNILVAANGDVKIRGFGVAAPIQKHVFGTAEYISPEQASGRPVDQRSNIYSLGAVMFFMLAGEPPFPAASPAEHLEKHQKEEPVSPTARKPGLVLPPRAEALILKALAKSSSRRHLTLRQFLREVESLGAEAETPAAEAAEPLSFVTPLHGVTALTGGKRPPSAEVKSLRPPPPSTEPDLAPAATILEAPKPPPQVVVVPASPAAQPIGPKTVPSMPAPAKPAAPAPAAAPAIVPTPTPAAPIAPQPSSPARRTQITGEIGSNPVALKAPGADEQRRLQEKSTQQQQQVAAAQAAPQPIGDKKAGFRETMWFFKGEVESAMAETGGDAPPAQTEGATAQELTEKYADDGSLSDTEARRLSLRTGKTQMMQQVKVPAGPLPGDKMEAGDLIKEFNRGRIIGFVVGGIVLVGIIVGVLVMVLR
jgi:serine/threonine protein kinase